MTAFTIVGRCAQCGGPSFVPLRKKRGSKVPAPKCVYCGGRELAKPELLADEG